MINSRASQGSSRLIVWNDRAAIRLITQNDLINNPLRWVVATLTVWALCDDNLCFVCSLSVVCMTLLCSGDGNYEVTLMTKATVYHSGVVIWQPPAVYKSSCSIDVEYFPYDVQTCALKLGSWTYDGLKVHMIEKLFYHSPFFVCWPIHDWLINVNKLNNDYLIKPTVLE